MTRVYIDGSSGTAGLQIHERISSRRDIELIHVPYELRHDNKVKKEAFNSADVVFLCLPEEAAAEAVGLIENDHVVLIDTSTAHRASPNWEYGFPELSGRRERIRASKRITNPGCHAGGFIALVEPLVREKIISTDLALSCFSVTGYSGGGKKMISEYESGGRDISLDSPRQYGLTQSHKHLPEMTLIPGLSVPPVFCPVVADYYSGLQVTVPLFAKGIRGSVADIVDIFKSVYKGPVVHFEDNVSDGGFLAANSLSGRDDMEIFVAGNNERILLISRFDNLGKGAAGAAVQNMNLAIGAPETEGLILGGTLYEV